MKSAQKARRAPASPVNPSLPSAILQRLRGELGLGLRDLARLTGFSEKSLSQWEAGKEPGEAAQRTVRSLAEFVDALSRVMKAEAIASWLDQPNPAFDGLKPVQLIEAGRMKPLWWMIHDLEQGDVT